MNQGLGPVLLIGAGRLGQALIQGWRRAEAFPIGDLMIRTPSAKPEADAAAKAGALLNPPDSELSRARTVVLCVKPQKWREVAAVYAPVLAWDAVILSVMTGATIADLSEGFGGRTVGRVIPTTGVAVAQGVASIWAEDETARARAHGVFDPIATTVELANEDQIDLAVAVSGSGVAYVYAFAEALRAAGEAAGLGATTARDLAIATVTSASAYLAESGADPKVLIEQVASPGGTTRAGLEVLTGEGGLEPLLKATVKAAAARSKALRT